MIVNSVEELIGNTPLVRISPAVHGLKNVDLYAKLEYYNPFGSVKDRIAKGMLEPFWSELESKGKTVVESSSGNTGKALAALCGIHGLDFVTVTNRIKIPEQRMMLQLLDARIDELPGFAECPDPSDPNNAFTVVETMMAQNPDGYCYPNQYFSELNVKAHRETGKELIDDLGSVDYYFGFLGTSGSTLGAGQVLKEHNPQMRVVGIVANAGNHIPGGREAHEMWEVGIFDRSFYHDILYGSVDEAIDGMTTLVQRCGLLCGPTSGLNYQAARSYLSKIDAELGEAGTRATAVFIACDRVEPYMSYLKKHRPALFSGSTTGRMQVRSTTEEETATVTQTTPEALSEARSRGAILIDIRGNFAFSVGHIAGSVNIVDQLFAEMIEQGPAFPAGSEIIVLCRIGDISRRYAAFLQKQGYTASSLEGGIAGWKERGMPLDSVLAAG
jgi:cysteine synthase B